MPANPAQHPDSIPSLTDAPDVEEQGPNDSVQLPQDADCLLTERHAADFLNVTTRALQAWRQRSGGPAFIRISSRCIRYRRHELIEWADARLKTSTTADQPERA